MIPVAHRTRSATEPVKNALTQFGYDLRVAMPATITSFDPAKQTVSAQPAIQEAIRLDAVQTSMALPELHDIPIVIPRAGGFSITLPAKAGDECLLIFADMCIDAWYQNGAASGPVLPPAKFRHAIGDGFAILGPWSQPRVLSNYSANSMQLRSDDGATVIDIAETVVTVNAPVVNVVSGGGTPQPLVNKAFWTWFTTLFMPAVQYKGPQPPALMPAPLTTILKGQ